MDVSVHGYTIEFWRLHEVVLIGETFECIVDKNNDVPWLRSAVGIPDKCHEIRPSANTTRSQIGVETVFKDKGPTCLVTARFRAGRISATHSFKGAMIGITLMLSANAAAKILIIALDWSTFDCFLCHSLTDC